VASLNKQYYEILYDSPSLNENKTKLKTNPQTKIYRQKIFSCTFKNLAKFSENVNFNNISFN
jgi:hypothetical protein